MSEPLDHRRKLGDLAAAAGLERIHMLAWRDLDDVEAGGSEVHAADGGPPLGRGRHRGRDAHLLRPGPARRGRSATATRSSARPAATSCSPAPRSARSPHRYGQRDALVEIWNGMPFFSPLWATGPRVVFLHHVHADMWKMVLPPNLARVGDTLERTVAPLLYRRSRMITLSRARRRRRCSSWASRTSCVEVVPPGIDPRFTPGGEPRADAARSSPSAGSCRSSASTG